LSDFTGRVSRVDLGICTILTHQGPVRAAFPHDADIAVGDMVSFTPGDPPRLDEIEPRRSAFVRNTAGQETRPQVVAANIDTVFLVNALDAPVNTRRIERALALGWQSGATPVVVLTKADVIASEELAAVLDDVGAVALGVEVHVVSAATGEGVDAMAAQYLQPGLTVALLGPSGAGKSTLVNALAGDEVMATGDVRKDGKGRHTTTHRELIPLPGGAFLIDTPGMRSLSLWEAGEGMDKAFADIEELAPRCKFNDCNHDAEPGCAVQAAIAGGALDAERLEGYRKLQRELDHLALRQDHQLRQAQAKKWKAIHKSMRNLPPKR
jgi:ribosome biogenesis GTPase / thiamine phosphate phosphatase